MVYFPQQNKASDIEHGQRNKNDQFYKYSITQFGVITLLVTIDYGT